MKNSQSKNTLITIIGNIASGKSTISSFIAKELKAKLVLADELYKINPFFKNTLQNRKRWSFVSDVWFLVKRLEIMESFNKNLNNKLIVQDSGIFMSLVYAHSRLVLRYMTAEEYKLYIILYNKLTRKNNFKEIILYLDLPIKTLIKRIHERGRKFEVKYHTKTYLQQIQHSLETFVKLYKKKSVVIKINQKNWFDIISNPLARKQLITLIHNNLNE